MQGRFFCMTLGNKKQVTIAHHVSLFNHKKKKILYFCCGKFKYDVKYLFIINQVILEFSIQSDVVFERHTKNKKTSFNTWYMWGKLNRCWARGQSIDSRGVMVMVSLLGYGSTVLSLSIELPLFYSITRRKCCAVFHSYFHSSHARRSIRSSKQWNVFCVSWNRF